MTTTADGQLNQVDLNAVGALVEKIRQRPSAAGIAIRDLRIDLDGDLDLHAFLGLTDGHPGFSAIRVAVHLDTDADETAVAALHAKVAATSPVGQTLSQPIPVEISPA